MLAWFAGRRTRFAFTDADLGLDIGGAGRVEADDARLGAELDHLDLRRPADGTHLVDRLDLALRQRVRDVALRPARAAHELRACLRGGLHEQVMPGLRTDTDLGVVRAGHLERRAYLGGLGNELAHDP